MVADHLHTLCIDRDVKTPGHIFTAQCDFTLIVSLCEVNDTFHLKQQHIEYFKNKETLSVTAK